MKKYLAEGLGAFALSMIVALSLSSANFPIPTIFLAGGLLAIMVYVIGGISGCHINPAVTIGLWSIKKIDSKEAVKYIAAQLVGAGITLLIISSLNRTLDANYTFDFWVLLAEMLGNFIFALGIAAVVYKKSPESMSGIVVGGSLFLGIAFAALLGSGGILNPAVALALNSFSFSNVLGELIGAVLGFQVYKYLQE